MVSNKIARTVCATAVLCAAGALTPASALPVYSQGFETDTSGWFFSTTGIDRVASGDGALGLPAASGDHYAQVNNNPNDYFPAEPSLGGGGLSVFGGLSSYPGSDFFQSIDVYLDTSWSPMSNGRFSVDMTASNTIASNYDFNTQSTFDIVAPEPSEGFTIDAHGSLLATVTESGWYTFRVDYARSDSLSGPSTANMSLSDAAGELLGSLRFENCSSGACTSSDDLGGTGYVSINEWATGFADDMLGIDNITSGLVDVSPVPVPAPDAVWLLGFAAIATGVVSSRHRRASRKPA